MGSIVNRSSCFSVFCLLIVTINCSGSSLKKVKKSADKQFDQECLSKHNYYRSRHGVKPLVLDEEISKVAKDWADKLAANGAMYHRPNNKYGENIFWTSAKNSDGEKPVQLWYDEINLYNWNKATFTSGTGHFTQVIWKDSKQLGCGKSTGSKGTYVVCNYYPPGNYIGKFKENVLPLK